MLNGIKGISPVLCVSAQVICIWYSYAEICRGFGCSSVCQFHVILSLLQLLLSASEADWLGSLFTDSVCLTSF